MLHEELTRRVLEAAFEVAGELGHGFVEPVYRKAMVIVLRAMGLEVEEEHSFQIRFHGQIIGDYRADLVVENVVILELKALKTLLPEHQAQTINYLKASGLPAGLLINFGIPHIQYRRCYL